MDNTLVNHLIGSTPMIDVRAPIEFAKGSFPTAVNLPLLTDEERHQVGTTFKHEGQEAAIECGKRLISERAKQERTQHWVDHKNQNPSAILFCARGGLRSHISQEWCREQDIDIELVEGGYRALRTSLMESFEDLCGQAPFTVVGGRTGVGKTIFLNTVDSFIDLEGAAGHRGSSFGQLVGEQTTQVNFEHKVAIKLHKLQKADPSQRILLEDEGRAIGRVHVPEPLREAMLVSPLVVLEASIEERVGHVVQDYVVDLSQRFVEAFGRDEGMREYAEKHQFSLLRISRRLGDKDFRIAKGLLTEALKLHTVDGDVTGYNEFTELLLKRYYDPMYDYQLKNKQARVKFSGDAQALRNWLSSNA